jgi:hypothetical protein
MSREDIKSLEEKLDKLDEKIDALADIRWRVIAHEMVAGALVTIAGLVLAVWGLLK